MKHYLLLPLLTGALLMPLAAPAGTHTFGLGVEGFYDEYNEPDIMSTESTYGSVTGYYSYRQQEMFGAIDARVSHGSSDYESPFSGTASSIPEWEFELRGRLGYSFPLWGGSLSPYTGVGGRYFYQQGQGRVSSIGAGFYDRRITQVYLPVGASYTYVTRSGWTITPMAELDLLLYGDVNSRLSNVSPLYYNISNDQEAFSGYGIRGELMFGRSNAGYAWQVGPFVRYWDVDDSEVTTAPDGSQWIEPKNDRTQIGIAARLLW